MQDWVPCISHFVPAGKCQVDMALVWLPPLRCNVPSLPRSEQVKQRRQCSNNQEDKDQKVRCCLNLNNRN